MRLNNDAKLDLIADDLVLNGDVSFKPDCPLSLKKIITQTLLRLPDDKYEELMRGEGRAPLEFIGCGPGQLGQTIRYRHFVPERVVILLSDKLCELQLEEAMFTVAHELAHAYLKHDLIHSFPGECDGQAKADANEYAADELAQNWGFSRAGVERKGVSAAAAGRGISYVTPLREKREGS